MSDSYSKASKELEVISINSRPNKNPTSTPAKYMPFNSFDTSKIKPKVFPTENPYVNAEKGIYVRCYDNSIKKVASPQEATNYNCDKHGGVYEYKTIQ